MKLQNFIAILGVIIAAVAAIINFFGNRPGSNSGVNANNNTSGGNLTIIQNTSKAEKIYNPSKIDDVTSHGALDGSYKSSNLDNGFRINFEQNEKIEVESGNCMLSAKLVPSDRSFVAYIIETDGICKFLDNVAKEKVAFRVIPDFKSRSNNGRFNDLYIESLQSSLDIIVGNYSFVVE